MKRPWRGCADTWRCDLFLTRATRRSRQGTWFAARTTIMETKVPHASWCCCLGTKREFTTGYRRLLRYTSWSSFGTSISLPVVDSRSLGWGTSQGSCSGRREWSKAKQRCSLFSRHNRYRQIRSLLLGFLAPACVREYVPNAPKSPKDL